MYATMDEATTVSQPSIGFYIHHHGAGHIMRAITIANALPGLSCIFMGSNLKPYQHLIPAEITCVHLPADLAQTHETILPDDHLSFVHYAPLGLRGQRERTALMTAVFTSHNPLLLIVDVSVEVALLARLCGIPTVLIKQHGDRNDLPHLQAYESATLIIAPFSASLAAPNQAAWVDQKTVYVGGFSKYSMRQRNQEKELDQQVAILTGEGGTSLNQAWIEELATSCSSYTFHVIGQIATLPSSAPHNLQWHGKLADPATVLSYCAIVIGNAGHNTVMEMATLNKRFICIPEERPFNEQQQKAQLLARNGHARVIPCHDLHQINWKEELAHMLKQQPDWTGVINPDALRLVNTAIHQTLQRLYPNAL